MVGSLEGVCVSGEMNSTSARQDEAAAAGAKTGELGPGGAVLHQPHRNTLVLFDQIDLNIIRFPDQSVHSHQVVVNYDTTAHKTLSLSDYIKTWYTLKVKRKRKKILDSSLLICYIFVLSGFTSESSHATFNKCLCCIFCRL